MARITIFGASGYAGSHIRAEATRRGHHVTSVTRTALAAESTAFEATASLYDRAAVLDLTCRCQVLVCAITAGPDQAGNTLPDAIPNLVAAAQSNGVRIGVVGGAGSLWTPTGSERVITQLAAMAPPDKLRDSRLHIEFLELLQQTPVDVDWFYLSPPIQFGAHAPGARRGHYRIGSDTLLTDEQGNSAIGGEDFASAFVDEVEQPQQHRRRFTVAY